MKKESNNNYIDKQELQNHLVEYIQRYNTAKALNKTLPPIPNKIGIAIMQICDGIARRPNFNGYSYINEMKSDAIEDCVKGVDLYRPDKFDNPFGYFSRIAWYAFLRRIEEEKYQNYLKAKNYQKSYVFSGLTENVDNDDHSMLSSGINSINDSINHVIREWEEKQAIKKQKISDKKKEKEKNNEKLPSGPAGNN